MQIIKTKIKTPCSICLSNILNINIKHYCRKCTNVVHNKCLNEYLDSLGDNADDIIISQSQTTRFLVIKIKCFICKNGYLTLVEKKKTRDNCYNIIVNTFTYKIFKFIFVFARCILFLSVYVLFFKLIRWLIDVPLVWKCFYCYIIDFILGVVIFIILMKILLLICFNRQQFFIIRT